MCLNCGCKKWDDDMGNSDNLTLDDLVKAAKASDQDAETLLTNVKEGLDSLDKEDLQTRIDQ